ncbi:hypothetical protein GCK72_017703 [Caenorhabditis remanei]|uniref:Chaperone DnaJ C-terminal domain-containing protein n=1 Tax=Caenorhabditis remanei TaxID=31234 RepID=A0A6A5G9H4_CAERE|nr:hypothetical protein GCK72_017703 [Caenorhabditis remanei]KAF1751149.1 hypothetical protein GCK72_017703 [Caenorhabditis remanei]
MATGGYREMSDTLLEGTVRQIFRTEGSAEHQNVRSSTFCSKLEVLQQDGAVKVPGINGDTYIHIPAGTGSHTKMRLIGKGVKRQHSIGHGDQVRLKEQSCKYFNSFLQQFLVPRKFINIIILGNRV